MRYDRRQRHLIAERNTQFQLLGGVFMASGAVLLGVAAALLA